MADDWRLRAACAHYVLDPDVFFPEHGDKATASTAKRVCYTCPVREECTQEAIRLGAEGIWGGYTEKSRQVIRAAVNNGRAVRYVGSTGA